MGNGAVISVLSKFVHPSKEIGDKYPVRAPIHQLEGCIIVREAVKTINQCKQAAVIFTHDNFPNATLYDCYRYLKIIEEAPAEMTFNKKGSRNETWQSSCTQVRNDETRVRNPLEMFIIMINWKSNLLTELLIYKSNIRYRNRI